MTTKQERVDLAELAEEERKHKPVRTAAQAGVGAAAVTVVEYGLAYFHADLDPWDAGTQQSFPPLFTGALFVLFAYLSALWMNRPTTPDPEAGTVELGYVLVAVIFFILGVFAALLGLVGDCRVG